MNLVLLSVNEKQKIKDLNFLTHNYSIFINNQIVSRNIIPFAYLKIRDKDLSFSGYFKLLIFIEEETNKYYLTIGFVSNITDEVVILDDEEYKNYNILYEKSMGIFYTNKGSIIYSWELNDIFYNYLQEKDFDRFLKSISNFTKLKNSLTVI